MPISIATDPIRRRRPDVRCRPTAPERSRGDGTLAAIDDTIDFTPFRALSFDCYGTLIDWERGILDALQPWTAWRGVDRTPAELLAAFAEHESQVQAARPAAPYPEVLAEVLGRIAATFDLDATERECRQFGASVAAWPAFPDSALALRRLAERYRLIILSNVDHASFAGSQRRLGVDFDLVITAEDVGSYKPAPAHFDALFTRLAELGVERHELLHVAQSMFHDHEPAVALGLPSVWIDRRHDRAGSGATPERNVAVAATYRSLAEFADAALSTHPAR